MEIPFAPNLRFIMGTDVKLADRDLGRALQVDPRLTPGSPGLPLGCPWVAPGLPMLGLSA